MTQENAVDRRRARRYSIFDTVQFTEVQSKTRAKARISDISMTGCYVDTLNPLPAGTQISLKLTLRGSSIEISATVVRSEPNMGMGVMFDRLEAGQQTELEKWLAERTAT